MSRAVALDDLARTMAARDATMPAEVALTIALLAVEAMHDEAAALDPAGVEVDGRGALRLTPLCPPADDGRALQIGVMTLLESMRVDPSSRVAALLARLRSQTTFTLTTLRAELAAQAPADRAAAQRAVGRLVQEFFRPAREEAEAEAARVAAMPAPRRDDDVVQALIAEAKAAEAEAAVMPGRQASVNIVGAEPAPLRPPPPAPRSGVSVPAVVAAAVLLLALIAVAWSRLHG
jgi:hypothetical protein